MHPLRFSGLQNPRVDSFSLNLRRCQRAQLTQLSRQFDNKEIQPCCVCLQTCRLGEKEAVEVPSSHQHCAPSWEGWSGLLLTLCQSSEP